MQKEIIKKLETIMFWIVWKEFWYFLLLNPRAYNHKLQFLIYFGKCRFVCLQEYLCRLETVSTVFEEILEHITKENMAKGKKIIKLYDFLKK